MKTRNKLVVWLTVFALLLGITPSVNVSAAKKISLSTKNLTITKGKSKTLKVKNTKKKVKWKVLSGKKYITLKKKSKVAVTIKGKKKGTAKVRATVGKRKLTCKVTVNNAKKATPTPTATATPSVAPTPSNPTKTSEPTNPANAPEGANADDVKALEELICIHRERGADISENLSNKKEYTWENGRLTAIDWRAKGLSGELNIEKLTALTKLYCDSYGENGTLFGEDENNLSNLILNESIRELYCADNSIDTLNTSMALDLTILDCNSNGKHQRVILDPEYTVIPGKPYPPTAVIGYETIPFLDLSKNTKLKELNCSHNYLETLDLSHNTALTTVMCHYNNLASLELNNHPSLKTLFCHWNEKLSSLNVSGATALTDLACDGNQLTNLDISHNTALEYLSCSNNNLTSLNVSQNRALIELTCSVNPLTSLDVSNNTNLEFLGCSQNQLTTLNVSSNTNLEFLGCSQNQLTTLNVSYNTALIELICYGNQLTSLDVSKNTALKYLDCDDNVTVIGSNLTQAD